MNRVSKSHHKKLHLRFLVETLVADRLNASSPQHTAGHVRSADCRTVMRSDRNYTKYPTLSTNNAL